jgi:hypothetical protein
MRSNALLSSDLAPGKKAAARQKPQTLTTVRVGTRRR